MSGNDATGNPPAVPHWAGWAGVIGPLTFALVVAAQGFFYDDYSHRSMFVSALAAYPYGVIQNVNFFTTGALIVAFGAAVARSRGLDAAGRFSGLLFAIAGLGLVGAGLFPMRMEYGKFVEPAAHTIPSVIAFLAAAFALIATANSKAARRASSAMANLAGLLGVAAIAGVAVMAKLAIPETGPLHANLGLVQRIVIACWMGGILLVALATLRRAKI